MEDDNIYIWAGFAKPGKHTVYIKDPLNLDGPIKETFLVEVRSQDLIKTQAPQVENPDEIKEQGASRLDTSILFGNWTKSTSSLWEACYNSDIQQVSFKGLVNTEAELFEIKSVIKNNYPAFIKAYTVLASHSSCFPRIDKARWELFC